MEKLHKEPDVHRQDYNAFVNELKLFHQSRGTPFRHLPRINGREIDLHLFYNQVTALGGLQKVNDHQKWDVIADAVRVPKNCANYSLALRQIYIRFLGHYEKIHFMGEEPDHDRSQSSESHNRKQQMALLHQVPMVYNQLQHEITDTARAATGLNQQFVSATDYDKLCMSFLSGLPNEQELALNVCTILSNEGNYMLHLENSPKLVNFLVAQAGVYPQDDKSLKELYIQSWEDLKGRDMAKFWRSTLDLQNPLIVQICDYNLDMQESESFFNLEADMGAHNLEGQRVLRIALILHNLSFEKNNVPVLVSNPTFVRFLLLCIHSSWLNLKQTAYDTLSNIAGELQLSLEKDVCSRIMFQSVVEGILSPDRYMVIRSMDVLSQLCSCELNEDSIPLRLDVEVYQRIVSFLTVHDIMLLFYALEALYALSDLGGYACEKIVRVHKSIGIFIGLLTLEPNQYGTSAQIKMKVVETLVPADPDPEPEPNAPPASTTAQTAATASTTTTTTVASVASSSSGDVDSETFVCNWLKTNYELAPGNSISRNEIYADYVGHCSKVGRKGVVNANVFASCVKGVFSQCGIKKIESGNGIITFHHDGLQRKKVVTSQTGTPITKVVSSCSSNVTPIRKTPCVISSSVTPKPGQKTSNSPILKAQLSAPPRSGITATLKRPIQSSTPSSKSVSSSPPPMQTYATSPVTPIAQANLNSGSSTLIKSLLANKVQQRNLQKQFVQPTVGKMIIYTQEKGGNITRHISQPTIMRAIRPAGPIPQSCVATHIARAPIQARIIANKGRVVTSGLPPRIHAKPPKHIFSSCIQPKPLRATALTVNTAVIPTSRINGLTRDIHFDVCTQADETKPPTDSSSTQESKPLQNHISTESSDSISSEVEATKLPKDSSVNSDSEKSFLFSQLSETSPNSYRMSGPNEFPTVSSSFVIVRSKSSGTDAGPKEQNGPNVSLVNNTVVTNSALTSQPVNQSKTASSPSSLLKSVLGEFDNKNEEVLLQQLDKEKICKRAPLLNGLLDKGKLPFSKEPQQFSLIQQNGNKHNNVSESNVEETKTIATNVTTLNPTVLSSPFQSNGDSLMQICTGQTTLSGTIEVQPDQKGVVRLHIESPENSNQGSDLSSISDITRTLECASKAISRTNAECNSAQMPFTGTCEATATVTVITTNTPTLTRAGQQIIVVTPALNQPQLHIQSPNIKFRILHSVSKVEDSVDLIGFPRVSLNQLNQPRQPAVDTVASTASVKRPSSDCQTSSVIPEVKKPRIDTKTPLLEATLRLPAPVPSTVSTGNGNVKSFHDNQTVLSKSITTTVTSVESMTQPPKLSTAKAVAVPVQNVEFPNEREVKTFSGLSSAGDHASVLTSSHVPPPKSSSSKLEYLCDWKDCGKKFCTPGAVFVHASKAHAPYSNEDMICLWDGCDSMKRRRFSLLTHLQDWHCNERVLHIQALRRKQISQQGKTSIAPPQMPPPHPGYAPDAALLAIRRHALQYLNPKELSEEKESALTKSIRLTSALILRNLVTHSSLARSNLRKYESELAYLAMSPVESARTVAQCLFELSRPHE